MSSDLYFCLLLALIKVKISNSWNTDTFGLFIHVYKYNFSEDIFCGWDPKGLFCL